MSGFGRRKSNAQTQPPPAATPVAPIEPRVAPSEPPPPTGSSGTVIVRRSAAAHAADASKAYELIQEVVTFVNAMTSQGLYERSEIPAKAIQAYHADYYLAQVNNGGHSQFIGNAGGNLGHVLADARAGLTAMKADAHLAIFERMAAWVAQHPDEAAKQTGFDGGRAPVLDELDKLFYAADKTSPMMPLSARWIASWPELKIVDDADYAEGIRLTMMMNPFRESRMVSRAFDRLRTQMTDWFHVGVGLACANISPRELKLAIGVGAVFEVEGQQQTAFQIHTNAAQRYCVVTQDHAAAYERVEHANPPMPPFGDVEGMSQAIRDGRFAQYKAPTVGKKLSHIKSQLIAGVIELANEYSAPAALDLLLRKAGIEPNGAVVSPMGIDAHPKGPSVNWLVAAGNQGLFAISGPNGSMLLRPTDEAQLATVSQAEAQEHLRHAGAATLKPN